MDKYKELDQRHMSYQHDINDCEIALRTIQEEELPFLRNEQGKIWAEMKQIESQIDALKGER